MRGTAAAPVAMLNDCNEFAMALTFGIQLSSNPCELCSITHFGLTADLAVRRTIEGYYLNL
jgi:hypothetical protein